MVDQQGVADGGHRQMDLVHGAKVREEEVYVRQDPQVELQGEVGEGEGEG